MHIETDTNFVGIDSSHPLSSKWTCLRYSDGAIAMIPHGFFRNWMDEDISGVAGGTFHIGRGSGLGIGSIVKYDAGHQSLRIGKFVAGGLRLKFLLNGQHEMDTISTCMFSGFGTGLTNVPPPQYGDTVIGHDVWIGDEVMFLGGSHIADGCVVGARAVVPPNFQSEAYGIYVGSPARLVRFRFSEKIREKLQQLAWWEMPLDWIKQNNQAFLVKLSSLEESHALELLQSLIALKAQALKTAL